MNKALLKRYRILLGKIIEKIYTNGFTSVELNMNAETCEDVLQHILMCTSGESFIQAMPEAKKMEVLATVTEAFLEFLGGRIQALEDIYAWADEQLKSDASADVEMLKILGEVICKNTNVGLPRDALAIRGKGDEKSELGYLAFARNAGAERTAGDERMYWSSVACAVAFGLRFAIGTLLIFDKNLALGKRAKASDAKGYSYDVVNVYGSAETTEIENIVEMLVEHMAGALLGFFATANKSGAKERDELMASLYPENLNGITRQSMDSESNFDILAEGKREIASLEEMYILQKNTGSLYANIWECPILEDQILYIRQAHEVVDTEKGLEVR